MLSEDLRTLIAKALELSPEEQAQLASAICASKSDGTLSDIEKSRLNVLLAEYNTLRNELVACSNKVYNIVSVGILMIMFALPNYGKPLFSASLIIGFTFVILLSILNSIDTRKLSLRVQQLESEINTYTGKTTLQWESKSGLYKKGGPLNRGNT